MVRRAPAHRGPTRRAHAASSGPATSARSARCPPAGSATWRCDEITDVVDALLATTEALGVDPAPRRSAADRHRAGRRHPHRRRRRAPLPLGSPGPGPAHLQQGAAEAPPRVVARPHGARRPGPGARLAQRRRAPQQQRRTKPDPLELVARGDDRRAAPSRRARRARRSSSTCYRRGQREPIPLFAKLSRKLFDGKAKPGDWRNQSGFARRRPRTRTCSRSVRSTSTSCAAIPAAADDPAGRGPGRAPALRRLPVGRGRALGQIASADDRGRRRRPDAELAGRGGARDDRAPRRVRPHRAAPHRSRRDRGQRRDRQDLHARRARGALRRRGGGADQRAARRHVHPRRGRGAARPGPDPAHRSRPRAAQRRAESFDDELLTHLAGSRPRAAGPSASKRRSRTSTRRRSPRSTASPSRCSPRSAPPRPAISTPRSSTTRASSSPQVCADVLAAAAVEDPTIVEELPTHKRLSQLVLAVLRQPGHRRSSPGPDADDVHRGRRPLPPARRPGRRRGAPPAARRGDDVVRRRADPAARRAPARARRPRPSLRRRYRVALIDEFQDTDPVQWQIFSTLFGGRRERHLARARRRPEAGDLRVPRRQRAHLPRGGVRARHRALDPRHQLALRPGAARRARARCSPARRSVTRASGSSTSTTAPEHVDRRLHDRRRHARCPRSQVRAALGPDLERNTDGKPAADPTPEAERRDRAATSPARCSTCSRTRYLPGGQRRDRSASRVRPHDIAVLVGTHAEATAMQAALRPPGHPGGRAPRRQRARVAGRDPVALAARPRSTRPSDASRARTAALSWFFGWSAERVDTASDDDLAEVQEQLYRWAEILETRGVVDFCAQVWSESDVTTRVLATPDGDRNLTDLDHLAQLLQASAVRPPARPGRAARRARSCSRRPTRSTPRTTSPPAASSPRPRRCRS